MSVLIKEQSPPFLANIYTPKKTAPIYAQYANHHYFYPTINMILVLDGQALIAPFYIPCVTCLMIPMAWFELKFNAQTADHTLAMYLMMGLLKRIDGIALILYRYDFNKISFVCCILLVV